MSSDISSPMATYYHLSASQNSDKTGALIDHGANSGIAGADCHVIEKMHHFINVEGINNHVMEKCPIVIAGGRVTNSNKGPIIPIMNQYALSGKCTSIHSSLQMGWYNVNVDDRSMKDGGKQQLKMIDGFVIPLNIRHRLPYMDMCPYTDKEWDELPHIHITREEDWDSSILDHEQSDDQDWYNQQPSMPLLFPMFDEHGELCHHIEAHTSCLDHVSGEPLPIEEVDEDSIFEDARDEMMVMMT